MTNRNEPSKVCDSITYWDFRYIFVLTLFCRMEKPRYEPFYRAGHEEKIGIVMTCSPVIDMTKDRDSNDMFAREFVSRKNMNLV